MKLIIKHIQFNRIIIYLFLLFLILATKANCQDLDSIINNIKLINEVHEKHTGMDASQSDQYKNYVKLRDNASKDQLLKLLNNENPVVACYASWALVDKGLSNIPDQLIIFLNNDKNVKYCSGCIGSKENISSIIYFRYFYHFDKQKSVTDILLFTLDSIVLFNEKNNFVLISFILSNRQFPDTYNKQIEYLAFEKINIDAIFYLSHWYPEKYKENVKNTLLKSLKYYDIKRIGTYEFFKICGVLLNLEDEKIKKIIFDKLRSVKNLLRNNQLLKSFLKEYHINESEL